MNYLKHIKTDKILNEIFNICKNNNINAYIIGGYVRDLILNVESHDIDIVVTNYSEVDLAYKITDKLNIKRDIVKIFKRYGTVSIKNYNTDIEIVKAKVKSYENKKGSLLDDQKRRDFTINTLALNIVTGDIIDPFNGLDDINNKIIKTPLNTNLTFKDDPIRILRAIRFAVKYNFELNNYILKAIPKFVNSLSLLSNSRLLNEFNKILLLNKPSAALELMRQTGLLEYLLPEVVKLNSVEELEGQKHKNNYYHTLLVVDQTREKTNNLVLLWTALLHDIGKYTTKKFVEGKGWTFHGHELVSAYMVKYAVKRFGLGQQFANTVKLLIKNHGRPKELVGEDVSDSAIRRFIVDLGDHVSDMLLFASCDMSTRFEDKREKMIKDLLKLYERIEEVNKIDDLRNFKLAVTGDDIMKYYKLKPSKKVGNIKDVLFNAVMDGIVKNKYDILFNYMINNNEIKKLL